ncbi:uncharacterized protein LOC132740271 [Ruditapes philippinarum]|uniref:uncharacterized protein LOC132740271 n=1 Tax=Ruditapes philippinarum TaxID=129788 RepID=UPI00295BF0DB|nr:uncharacterized protein LOC132740271 [Ruditapes philippinarum]
MSTVLLMADTWQPTVLRLVPFSNNNARSPDKKGLTKGSMSARNFPVLAVTRSSANSDSRSESKSVNSHRSEMADDISVFSDANYSEITTKTSYLDQPLTPSGHRKKYAKKKVPEVYSDMKEAMKFSVQDLNDQISSSSSLHSSEYKDDSKDKYSKLDNTRTKLPKPSICSSPDSRFCSPINGVRRSVPLTPGEMELQRVRESYCAEQIQKRKKYKLNINQLPRSTTPINDHDPDKLNMKQVIAFLQTKSSKDTQKKIINDKRAYLTSSNGRNPSRGRTTNCLPGSPKVVTYENDSVPTISRSNTVIKEDKLDPDNTRTTNGCVSVMSTKSTPNFSSNLKSGRDSKISSTTSVKSFKERSKDRKHSKHKPMKEFKLYRFLAVAPDGRAERLATSFTDSVPVVESTVLRTETSKHTDTPRKILRRRSNREIGTAHVLHRHASNRSATTPPKVETQDSFVEEQNKTIRLPIMPNGENDTADIDSDSCSTTSATCNSVQNSSSKEDRSKYPKKGQGDCPYMKTYSQEIVRLTLRHEKGATRFNSYMSDIQQGQPSHWHEQYSNSNDDDMPHGNVTSFKYVNYHEGKQWLDNSKHLLNNISNNSFIKVREKLRETNT